MPTVRNILKLKKGEDVEKAHVCIQTGKDASDYHQYHLYAKNDKAKEHPSKLEVTLTEAKAIARRIKKAKIEGVVVEGISKKPIQIEKKESTKEAEGEEASVEIN